jgi:prephenate dehydrogenase
MTDPKKPLIQVPANVHSELLGYRDSIDKIDIEISRLLNERAKLVYEVGEFKRKNHMQIYDPKREKEIRLKIRSRTKPGNTLTATELEKFFMGLIDNCRFFEAVHVRKTEARLLFESASIDFNRTQKVMIMGFGLLGSSLFLSLRDFFPEWHFYIDDPHVNVSEFEDWKKENFYENISIASQDDFKSCTLFVLAAPIEENQQNLNKQIFPKNSLVFDLGSTKRTTHHVHSSLNHDFIFVGGHPLAGKEVTGFQNGDPTLFFNKTFCWTKYNEVSISNEMKNNFNIIAMAIGAIPIWVTPEEHDRILAWSSHLPQILSTALGCLSNEESLMEFSTLFPHFASEIIRIGGSQFSMWDSILKSNADSIHQSLNHLINKLQDISKDLDQSQKMEEYFKKANLNYQEFKSRKIPGL